MAEEKSEIMSERQKLFIKRERLRRELFHTRSGETICLNGEQATMLLEWLKELERKARE